MNPGHTYSSGRVLAGAIAGTVGTMGMTMCMRWLHQALPPDQAYPLPPREIVQTVLPQGDERFHEHATTAAHFAYGAATGAFLGAITRRPPGAAAGAAYGVAVWAASYLGWIPAAGILKPAVSHPARRNALMLTAHVVWGALTALCIREIRKAEESAFANSRAPDQHPAARATETAGKPSGQLPLRGSGV